MTTIPVVRLSDLGALTELGEGGEGTVYACSSFPKDVFKKFLPAIMAELQPQSLQATIEALQAIPPADRDYVAARSTWPHTIVVDGPRFLGYLMARLPDTYYCTYGPVAYPKRVECTWDLLSFRRRSAANRNLVSDVSGVEMTAIVDAMLELTRVVEILHQHRIVIGDLSGRNVLWSAKSVPRVCLIDCDGFRFEGQRAVTRPKQSPDWIDTTCGGETSITTDQYKLGLAMFRACFAACTGMPQSHSLSQQDREEWNDADIVRSMALRAMGANRPSASEWRSVIEGLARALRFRDRPNVELGAYERPRPAEDRISVVRPELRLK